MEFNCAFDLGKKCGAVTEKKCAGCKFFKTEEQLKEGRSKAAERIRRLDPELKSYLFHKYFPRRRGDDDV